MWITKKYLFENFVGREEYELDKNFIANKLFEIEPDEKKYKMMLDKLGITKKGESKWRT